MNGRRRPERLSRVGDYPNGAFDQIKRAVSENAGSLDFKTKTWE